MASPSKTDKIIVILATQKHDCKSNVFCVEVEAVEKKHNLQLYLNMGEFRKDSLLSNAQEISRGIVLTWTPVAQQQMIMSNLAAKEWITAAGYWVWRKFASADKPVVKSKAIAPLDEENY